MKIITTVLLLSCLSVICMNGQNQSIHFPIGCKSNLISKDYKKEYNQTFVVSKGRRSLVSLKAGEGYLYVKKDGYWILINEDGCKFSLNALKANKYYFKSNKEFGWAYDLDTKPVKMSLGVPDNGIPKKWKAD